MRNIFVGTIVLFLLGTAVAAVVGILGAIPVYFLWNWLVPTLFALPAVTFWQAWGLIFLCSFLFKSHSSSNNESK